MATDEHESWRAAYALLDDLLDRPVEERDAALAAHRPSPEVALKVRQLLAAAESEESGLLDQPPPWPPAVEAPSPLALAGARFGPYEIVEEIGRGGMSVVFRARRADGQFERDVALKLLSAGQLAVHSAEGLRHEQAVLARLEHPGIATLLDGGVSTDGTPWLAMELVDGEPIDAWCTGRALDAAAIVGLFLRVCEAVAFAHHNLVVHRDIKPSNIFVDRTGRVRLLDFGIAKLLGDAAPEATATRVLTPGYGAPEQLTGRGVTTATDVFAMGAVLYRLLARKPAFPRRDDARRDGANDQPPPPPSTVSTGVPGVDGDLDNAILMALRPEAERRYPTAEAFGDDLRRWIDGRPLLATPDTLAYRVRKYAGRHRGSVVAAALAVAGLLAGTSVAVWQAMAARQESRKARAATAETQRELLLSKEVTRFLVDTFAAADPTATGGADVSAKKILEQGARRIERELEGQPVVRRQLLSVLGEITFQLGDLEQAEKLLGQALAANGATPEERVHDLRLAGATASAAGNYDLAERRFAEGLAMAESAKLGAGPRVEIELEYATHLSNSNQDERAEGRIRRLLASRWFQQAGSVADGRAAITLAQALAGQGRPSAAREWAERAVPALERGLGDRHVEVAAARSILANIVGDIGELEQAETLERQAVAIYLETYGPGNRLTLQSQNNLATHLKNRGRFAESAALLEGVLAAQKTALGPDHPYVASTYFNLGEARLLAGDVPAALASYRRAVEMADANPAGLGVRRGVFHAIYGRALAKAGDVGQAEAEFDTGLGVLTQALGATHPSTARVGVEYAAFLNDRGRQGEARRRLVASIPVLAAAYGEGSRELALANLQLGRAELASDLTAARQALSRARAVLESGPFRLRYRAEIEQAAALLARPAPGG
ncbi:MAG TPA: serine/threonine-protein kinase [Thermoanaerobaculia bacterium]|jgi:serine/threonine-protein kinase|nr:serine/threonine-protein kinase [Thermoanaerobaculia bacterium]